MAKILFMTGTHGSGKTHIAERLEKDHGYVFYRSNVSTFVRSYGGLKVQMDPMDRLNLQREILDAWKQQYKSAIALENVNVVFDRCPIDFLAYQSQEYDRLYADVNYHTGCGQYHFDCVLAASDITMRSNCKIVYVPMLDEFSDMERGDDKGNVGHHAKMVDTHIQGIMADNDFGRTSVGTDRDQRLNNILHIMAG